MKHFNDLIKHLLVEQPQTAPAPVKPKPSTPTQPGTPSKPSKPHPLTPDRPGVSPKPQARKRSKVESEDNEEKLTGKVTHYKN